MKTRLVLRDGHSFDVDVPEREVVDALVKAPWGVRVSSPGGGTVTINASQVLWNAAA